MMMRLASPMRVFLPMALMLFAACTNGEASQSSSIWTEDVEFVFYPPRSNSPEPVEDFSELQEELGWGVTLPGELPNDVQAKSARGIKSTHPTSQAGSRIQIRLTPMIAEVTIHPVPVGRSGCEPIGEVGGVPVCENSSDPQFYILAWETCDRTYTIYAYDDTDPDDVREIARAFIEACDDGTSGENGTQRALAQEPENPTSVDAILLEAQAGAGEACGIFSGSSLAEAPQPHGIVNQVVPIAVEDIVRAEGLELADLEDIRLDEDSIVLGSRDPLQVTAESGEPIQWLAAAVEVQLFGENNWQVVKRGHLYECDTDAVQPTAPVGTPIEVTPLP